MPKVTVTLEVDVDPEWIDFCVNHTDMFMHGYIGYWAQGVERSKDPKRGWLIWEFDMDDRKAPSQFIDRMTDEQFKKHHVAAVRAWKDGQPLPPHYHVMNEEACMKAWAEGVKKWGLDWYENGDANSYDVAMQLALLGEIRYG